MSANVTWKDLTVQYPEFVQWVVARFGPLPDGKVTQADYECFAEAYRNQ
jgi:hypothetical protein